MARRPRSEKTSREPRSRKERRVAGGFPPVGVVDVIEKDADGDLFVRPTKADAASHARVTRARAPLRDAPDPKSSPHGFLVAGDSVIVLDRNAAGGLVKVLYVNAKGVAIERWIAGRDIAAP